MRTALITGISGQDGSFLTELLLSKGYKVHGLVRCLDGFGLTVSGHLADQVQLHVGDLAEPSTVRNVIDAVQPDEMYNLAAQSEPHRSFEDPSAVAQVTGTAVVEMLDAIRGCSPATRFYQASTSEIFGMVGESPQTERTPLAPRNPYGAAKAFAHLSTGVFRRHMDVHASCGILFNHESPRRGPDFVTRKVTAAAAEFAAGRTEPLRLGALDARRDWGAAPDHVEAMWLMLQQDEPDDYVVATGVTHSVEDLCSVAFASVDLDWRDFVEVDQSLVRPPEQHQLVGDASKARERLGWQPRHSFTALIEWMVEAEVERSNRGH